MQIAKKIGKIAALVGVCPGFVGNRILAQRQREAQKLIMEGAMPWDVDRVLYDFGLPMGPFAMSDLAVVPDKDRKKLRKNFDATFNDYEAMLEHIGRKDSAARTMLRKFQSDRRRSLARSAAWSAAAWSCSTATGANSTLTTISSPPCRRRPTTACSRA